MAKTHPHIDMPTNVDLERLIDGRPEFIQQLYLGAHDLIVEAVPEITYSVDEVDCSIGYAAHQFGYNGWGMIALTPYTKWVTMSFLLGAKLNDPKGILEGSSAVGRHLKLTSMEQFSDNRSLVEAFVKEAARLYS